MKFIAHTENAKGETHLLSDHLRGVASLAREFATAANPEMAEPAEWAGLLLSLRTMSFRRFLQWYSTGSAAGWENN